LLGIFAPTTESPHPHRGVKAFNIRFLYTNTEIVPSQWSDIHAAGDYDPLRFWNLGEGTGGNAQAPRSSIPFDSSAKSDLESLWRTIHATKTNVFAISEANYDSTGRLAYAEFMCSKGFVSQRYVYHPGHTLPNDLSHERWHTAIDENWYYRRDDWN
jgi:hypothetical protein